MSTDQKETLSKWLPLIISLIGQAVLFGIFYGSTKSEIAALHETDISLKAEIMPMPQRMIVFVPRSEYSARMDVNDRDIAEIKNLARESNQKIDALDRRVVQLTSELIRKP